MEIQRWECSGDVHHIPWSWRTPLLTGSATKLNYLWVPVLSCPTAGPKIAMPRPLTESQFRSRRPPRKSARRFSLVVRNPPKHQCINEWLEPQLSSHPSSNRKPPSCLVPRSVAILPGRRQTHLAIHWMWPALEAFMGMGSPWLGCLHSSCPKLSKNQQNLVDVWCLVFQFWTTLHPCQWLSMLLCDPVKFNNLICRF